MLYGPVDVVVDHRNLTFPSHADSPRLVRWREARSFDVTLRYLPGASNVLADTLSRLFEVVPALRKALLPLATPDSATGSGPLHLTQSPPAEQKAQLLALAHSSLLSAHAGVTRTTARLATSISWPHMTDDVSAFVRACPTCQKKNAKCPHPSTLLAVTSSGPFELLEADHIGPLPPDQGYRHVLVLVDRWRPPVSSLRAGSASMAPTRLITDGGPAFDSDVIRELCRTLGVDLHISTPHSPQSHGSVERANRVIGDALRAFFRDSDGWIRSLPAVQYSLNSLPNRSIGMSPFRAVHGFQARDPVSANLGERAYAAARKAYARQAHGQVKFDEGDYVLLHFDPPHKLASPWRGPYQVLRSTGPVTYELRDLVNEGDPIRAHVNRMYPFEASTLTPDQLRREALKVDEYEIDSVRAHRYVDGALSLNVQWGGYPDYGPDDERSWVLFSDSHWAPAVKKYVADHALALSIPPPKKPNPCVQEIVPLSLLATPRSLERLQMLVVSLLAMSQTLRSHSSTCDSEIRTITGHARNSFRAQVLLKPVFHLGLIDLVAREGEYSERSESLLNNRPVVLWVCTWHLHVALFIPSPFFVPEGKPPTSNLSLRQNLPKPKIVSVLNSHVGSSVARASMLKGPVPHFGHAHRGLVAGFFARIGDCLLLCKM
ncbi:putative Transposon Ty3-I Gag-Pol polyprotein [Paratrimastix pyriformis]|uniref:Transposon Ty3-I Gag-Pol polyprotein n=1 Tax=Paratrimastix pyriformis TaxID=342808 RepID=A0ABQ8UF61_9EUKA|nr:putative Transposon Ty3-I Gag-Pol polyprotein [Paratrimastix pyriformis]